MSFHAAKRHVVKPNTGVQINSSHLLSQGLVGSWLFNEGAGSRVNDISGHGNHGVFTGIWENNMGYCANTTDVSLGSDPPSVTFSNTEPWTAEVVVYWPGNTGETYASFIGSELSKEVFFIKHTNNRFAFRDSVSVWHYFTNGSSDSCIDTVSQVVFTGDGDGHIDLFKNGLYIESINAPTQIRFENFGSPWDTYYGNIYFSKASIYNRVLPDYSIKQLYRDPFCNLLRVPIRYVPAAAGGLSIPVAMYHYRQQRIS